MPTVQAAINQPEFDRFCEQLGFSINSKQSELLRNYLELLLKWNSKINLTAASDWQSAMRDLIADSFHLTKFIEELTLAANPVCWDLGAGGGLPGIPLRILWENGSYHLVEVREKRALFLQTVLAKLKLAATFAHRADAGKFMNQQLAAGKPANLILSRAFMPWQKLLPYVDPYFAPGGILLLLLKGDKFNSPSIDWKLAAQTAYPSPSGPRQFVALQKN